MRVFALSDIHVDHDANAKWVDQLSRSEHLDDLLILAGDVTDRLPLLGWCLEAFARRFRKVLFVPGNHDVWVIRDDRGKHSLQKFEEVRSTVEASGASMRTHREAGLTIHPVLGWYDYSFGEPSDELQAMWMDYRACRWPENFGPQEIAAFFDARNRGEPPDARDPDEIVVTFSHFLPRIDLMPWYISGHNRLLYPILGSDRIEAQLRRWRPDIHVYGHSHVNRDTIIDGVRYVNNAFGYPGETWIAAKQLVCIHER